MKNVMAVIASGMESLGLNYSFMEWEGRPRYPYFIGEYQETEPATEDGLCEASFLLTGFTRGTWREIEEAREKIRRLFHPVTGFVVNASGSTAVVFYASSFPVQTGDAELKKIQINLTVKEWSVI